MLNAMQGDIKKLITPKEAAAILGVSLQTLNAWRCTRKRNLRYYKIGRKVMYCLDDVLGFIDAGVQA